MKPAAHEQVSPSPTQYVTFFDSVYLPQGLALHESIHRYDPQAQVTVYAMDSDTRQALKALDSPNLEVRDGWERMPHELQDLRGKRDWVSLLWTSTPFVIADKLRDLRSREALYYMDADMAFFRDPQPVKFEFESSDRDVLITAHNFAAEYDASESVGEFAVQFIGVKRGSSEEILDVWERQCLEACPATPTNGAFGDQKYLDSWPADFPGRVHIASNQEWFQGPWNAVRFPASRAIAYHFHGLRILAPDQVRLTTHYRLPDPTVTMLYAPYVDSLGRANAWLARNGIPFKAQAAKSSAASQFRQFAGRIRRVWRTSGGSRFLTIPPFDGSGW